MTKPRSVEEDPPLDPEFGIMFLLETEEDVERWLSAEEKARAMTTTKQTVEAIRQDGSGLL
jgi:hypothetical protein